MDRKKSRQPCTSCMRGICAAQTPIPFHRNRYANNLMLSAHTYMRVRIINSAVKVCYVFIGIRVNEPIIVIRSADGLIEWAYKTIA